MAAQYSNRQFFRTMPNRYLEKNENRKRITKVGDLINVGCTLGRQV